MVSGTLLLVNTNSVAGLTSPVVSQSSVSVSSLSGSVRGGNTVKLKGNFGVPTRVSFGGKAAKIIGKPSTGIVTVVTPAHSHGPVDIKITTNKGIVIAQKAFIYNQYG
ncbi:IPT/TIG domain-containing protein [Legionella brunensis]|uniref:IPT/TIG domain-containing protein n=1 Tax=Legionella brunensis TaxID=29422 RepID=A0A0W0SM08_9GAMM|nr:IPT/TIG domain-containing protein [Legionella brunensis]KTC84442.1 hypothetical protein Lbru_1310 [Legionella brunensis]